MVSQVFKPYCQTQQFLLPPSLDDFVGKGHIARLISAIIDQMDISFILETYKGGGTSAYNPNMLLKAWILGFVNRVYSCRLLAKAIRESLPFIWISGNQKPDFHTLNNFRLRLKDDIKKVFKQIVVYAIEQGIIEGKDVFIDHSKQEANANKHKVVWRKQVDKQLVKIDAELDELFDYVDKLNENEDKLFRNKDLPEQERDGFDKDKVKEIVDRINKNIKDKKISREEGREKRDKVRRTKELLERNVSYKKKKAILQGRNSYSRTDTDAVAMMMKDKLTIRPGYNEGIATEKGFVVNYVVSDCPGDTVSFVPLMEGVIHNLGQAPETATSDGAYGNEENHTFLEKHDVANFLKFNTFHKEKSKKWQEGKIRFEDFSYDKERDEFTCKNGAKLVCTGEKEELTKTGFARKIRLYKAEEGKCLHCPFRALCTKAEARTLQVSWNGERLKQQARENLHSDKGKELRARRGNEVESVLVIKNSTKRREDISYEVSRR